MTDPRVMQALATPTLGHLDPLLLELYQHEQELLRLLFQTRNEWTFALSGTGTSGMEAALANLLEPGDAVLAAIAGYFGGRMAEIASRLGGQVDRLEKQPGEIFEAEEIGRALRRKKYKLLTLVQAETSTGAEQLAIAEIATAAHTAGSLLLLDTVTSLGGIPVLVDEWQVDAAYSASQKNLSAPPGLAPITFGPRARQVVASRRTPVPSFYLDLGLYANYWGGDHAYHHTAPSGLHFALTEALELLLAEGLEPAFARFRSNAEELWKGLDRLGAPPFIPARFRLPPLTTARVPPGCDPQRFRRQLLNDYNIEIAAGLGALRDHVWRIGLMGYSSRPENITRLLAALKDLLPS
jgi:alanine-glyoxylate transaminase/serine-glyoxylate transaminase/serine-pyruvate transaminase